MWIKGGAKGKLLSLGGNCQHCRQASGNSADDRQKDGYLPSDQDEALQKICPNDPRAFHLRRCKPLPAPRFAMRAHVHRNARQLLQCESGRVNGNCKPEQTGEK